LELIVVVKFPRQQYSVSPVDSNYLMMILPLKDCYRTELNLSRLSTEAHESSQRNPMKTKIGVYSANRFSTSNRTHFVSTEVDSYLISRKEETSLA
jgi:hypothetical protein